MARIQAFGTTGVESQGIPGAWCKDDTGREHNLPGGVILEATEFYSTTDVVVTVGAGGAAEGDTTVPVEALGAALQAGTVLNFDGTLVTLADNAAAAATSITVDPLPAALAQGDSTTTGVTGDALATVVSGTLIGRTYAERDAGAGFGPADVAADDQIYILLFDVQNVQTNPEAEVYRHGGLVAENYLPGWDSMTTAEQTWVRDNYEAIVAAP